MKRLSNGAKRRLRSTLKTRLLNVKNFSEDPRVLRSDKIHAKKTQREIAKGYRHAYKQHRDIQNRVNAIIHRSMSSAIKVN